jgi:uncharacterized membrane protein
MDFILKLFGIRTTNAEEISRAALHFRGVNPVFVMLGAMLLAGMTVWMYRRAAPDVSRFRKLVLAGLRSCFLLMVLGLLLRPVLGVTFTSNVRRTLILLMDTSASMSQIQDKRLGADDVARAAIARNQINPAGGLKQSVPGLIAPTARLDLVKAVFGNPALSILPALSREYDLVAFGFDRNLREIPQAAHHVDSDGPGEASAPSTTWVSGLTAEGPYTALGDAIREAIAKKRGQPLAGVLLVTDGAGNSGQQPVDAARLAGLDKAPLYIYGVGITSPRDIVVSGLLAQDVAFARDRVPITVRVRSMGMAGQSASVRVALGGQSTDVPISFSGDGEQLVTAALTPAEPGEFELSARIEPRDDEVVRENNSAAQRIRVVDDKIKVLYVEQSPRWEFKYIQAALMRDRRIALKILLVEADPSVSRQSNSPFVTAFPSRKEDLFKYDLVILGDVDPKIFGPGQLESIEEFVSRFGGALVALSGKQSNPGSFRRTPVEKMLPVELESVGETATGAARGVRLELTPSGKANAMLRLEETELESAAAWGRMPWVYWVNRVARAKPAADVLVVDPDPARSTRFGKMPVIALQQYGLGQVMYVGTDNLWRWRRNTGDHYHAALWGQIVQRLALPHLLGASKRTQLTSDQKSYPVGSKATIYARLFTETFEPITEPVMKAQYMLLSVAGQNPRELTLRAVPDQPGMYRGEILPDKAGQYEVVVIEDKSTTLRFEVVEPKAELAESAMNETLLRQMAAVSGGAFFREEDLHTLVKQMGGKRERIQNTREIEIWSSPIYFLLMLGILIAEWITRKISQLK